MTETAEDRIARFRAMSERDLVAWLAATPDQKKRELLRDLIDVASEQELGRLRDVLCAPESYVGPPTPPTAVRWSPSAYIPVRKTVAPRANVAARLHVAPATAAAKPFPTPPRVRSPTTFVRLRRPKLFRFAAGRFTGQDVVKPDIRFMSRPGRNSDSL